MAMSSKKMIRALFRVRAGNKAGWGAWSLSSAALEAQDIILPIKRGATQMLMRWFNKPQADILKWELSRRVCMLGHPTFTAQSTHYVRFPRDVGDILGRVENGGAGKRSWYNVVKCVKHDEGL